MSFLCFCICRGSCRSCVICIRRGARVVFVLFVFIEGSHRFRVICMCRGLVSFFCFLYL